MVGVCRGYTLPSKWSPSQKKVFILECSFNGGSFCDFNDFEPVIHRQYGFCFLFKPPTGVDLREIQVTLFADMTNPSAMSDINFFGLSFVHVSPDGKLTWDITPGINVFAYPKGSYPHQKHRTRVSMGMEHHMEVRQDTIQLYNTARKPCLDASKDTSLFHFTTNVENYPLSRRYKYSTEDCVYNTVTQHFVNKCGCIPIGRHPTAENKNYTYCGNITAVEKEKFQKQWTCYQLEMQKIHQIDTSDCINTCETTFYARYLSSTKWPLQDVLDIVIQNTISQYLTGVNATIQQDRRALTFYTNKRQSIKFYQDLLNDRNRQFNTSEILTMRQNLMQQKLQLQSSFSDNFMKFRIFTRQSQTTITKEYRAYPIERLLSDFGGVVGLYLGVSVLTLADLFNFLVAQYRKVKNKNAVTAIGKTSSNHKDIT